MILLREESTSTTTTTTIGSTMCWLHLLVILGIGNLVLSLDNGLAKTPPMGWTTGERFFCNTDCTNYPDDCISEKLIKTMADIMAKDGYKNAGYQYVAIGDCWMAKSRDSKGQLQPDAKRFQSGMKSLASYVHSKGLKLGLYLEAGNVTQGGYPGSQGHLQTDAQTLASWGVDMVTLDAYSIADTQSLDQVFPEMGQYLNQTGQTMLYVCNWPVYQLQKGAQPNYELISKTCNVFKSYPDMLDSWESLLALVKKFGDLAKTMVNYTGPGNWAEVDQVLVGNYGLSFNQQEMQLALWSVMSSSLFVSADLRKIRPDSRSLLLNQSNIAVNQDELGFMGYQITVAGQVRVWVKPIKPKGSFALALTYENISGGPSKVTLNLEDIHFTTAAAYNFTNIFTGDHIGIYKPWHTFNCEVEPTGVLFINATALP